MLVLIFGFATNEERIREVLLNGSRTNPDVTPDPFQDFDVATYVTDVEPFTDCDSVVPIFGDVLVVEQPLIGPWPPSNADGSFYNYHILMDRELLKADPSENLLSWRHSGFSIDSGGQYSLRIFDDQTRENLAEYMARLPRAHARAVSKANEQRLSL